MNVGMHGQVPTFILSVPVEATIKVGRLRRTNFEIEPSSRRQPHVELAAGGRGVPQERLRARQRMAAFQPGDGGLAGAHAGSELGLRQSGAHTRFDQLGGYLELRSEGVVFGLDLRVGHQTSLEVLKWNGHAISVARRSASAISARGVFRLFFTNARTTTTLRRSQ